MPCNAVATARARVDVAQFIKVLDISTLARALPTILTERGCTVKVPVVYSTYAYFYVHYNGYEFRCRVQMRPNAIDVDVSPTGRRAPRGQADALAKLITDGVGVVGAARLSQAIQALLKKQGAQVTSNQMSSAGAVVTRLKV